VAFHKAHNVACLCVFWLLFISFDFNQLTQFSPSNVKHNISDPSVNISESAADTESVSDIKTFSRWAAHLSKSNESQRPCRGQQTGTLWRFVWEWDYTRLPMLTYLHFYTFI